jgi:hypothetical protein
MNSELRHRLTCITASGLCGVGWFSSAMASPPIGGAVRSSTVQSRTFAHQEHPLAAPLDLSPRVGGGEPASESFPSAFHHLDPGKENLGTTDGHPGLRAGELNYQVMSQAEIIARRIHREGLPLARLWESKSALLSVGLNQRGKPGIWLTQKIH